MTHDRRLLALIANSIAFGACLIWWALLGSYLGLALCLVNGVLVLVNVERRQGEVRE